LANSSTNASSVSSGPISLHENQYYLKGHMVEDPIAKVQFPKYAAGATLQHGGKTLYFINESTLRDFEPKQAAKL
jgi:YHS domain-containing protein